MKATNLKSVSWRRYSLMVISVLIATLLWLYVNNIQYPPQEREFRINLQASGLPEGMVVEDMPERVSVRVQSSGTSVNGLNADDFKATVDLSQVKIGENKLTVDVSTPLNVNITAVNPKQITVSVDKSIQKQLPVKLFLRGDPQPGFTAGEPVLVPKAVLASGPSKVLNNIDEVPVTMDVEGASHNLDYTLPLALQQSGIRLSPEVVRVVVPINISVPFKAVPVKINTSGTLPEGYELVSTSVKPLAATVYAPGGVLAQISEVSTKGINLSNVNGNIRRTVDLQLPQGAALLQPDQVEVTIEVKQKPVPPPEEQPPTEEEPVEEPTD
ncbi:CdaR family protein [Peptococcaceae bacterium 1198_IL3148]